MSNINRITGTNSGIDVDSVVKASLTKEQNKIDKAYKQQKVYEYQQEQLKKIMGDCSDFYDKYLNRLSSTSLLSDSSYETATFTSSDGAVTAKGYAGAIVTDYKVSVSQIAERANRTLNTSYFDGVLTSDLKAGVLSVKMKNNSGKNVYADIDVVVKDGEVDMSATAKALTKELNKKGIGVTAKYSSISKGIILESNSTGEDVTFGVELSEGRSVEDLAHLGTDDDTRHSSFSYEYYTGKNSKGSIIRDGNIYQIDTNSNIVTVDNVQFTLNSVNSTAGIISDTDAAAFHLYYNNGGDSDPIISSGGKVTLESSSTGRETVIRKGVMITTQQLGEVTLKQVSYKVAGSESYADNDAEVSGDLLHLTEDDVDGIDVVQSSGGSGEKIIRDTHSGKVTTIYSDGHIVTKQVCGIDGHNVVVQTTTSAKDEHGNTTTSTEATNGTSDPNNKKGLVHHLTTANASSDTMPLSNMTIEKKDSSEITTTLWGINESGQKQATTTTVKSTPDGKSTQVSTIKNLETGSVENIKNSVDTATELTGKTDIKNLKDTLIKFVNDYNTLISSINDKLWEKRDRDYTPLTEAQQSEMTDKQIEAWNKKAQAGLLRSDSDLERIQSSMKRAMSTLMNSTGLSLEQMGIKPVDNYNTKNGTFTIDESKLTSALENNSEAVKDLFTRAASGDDKGGILTQLQSTFKSEIKSSTSILSKRVGLEGTATETSNTLSKYIENQKKLVKELKKKYTDRENALYKKYSALEVAMGKLNSQSNSLYSMLGIN